MTIDEVLTVARAGAAQGCTEALFTLGDKPELLYPEAAQELASMGYTTTMDYVIDAARAVLREAHLLPHVNAGVMSQEDIQRLRRVSASQGLMLETVATGLQAHSGDCPDKDPGVRMEMMEAAGRAQVPFTTGILIGIGESKRDRIEALLAIRGCHRRHGHIQEVIIQNFRAKKGTPMALWPEPSLHEFLETVATARLILGPDMSIQAPPNLTPSSSAAGKRATNDDNDDDDDEKEGVGWQRLIDAGINDWGGVSPVTRDWVNPERPWPHISTLAKVTERAGKVLVPRLPSYPGYLNTRWMDAEPLSVALKHADVHGLGRASTWYAGEKDEEVGTPTATTSSDKNDNITEKNKLQAPLVPLPRPNSINKYYRVVLGMDGTLVTEKGGHHVITPNVQRILDAIMHPPPRHPYSPTVEDIVALFEARGADFHAILSAADALRHRLHGDSVSFVVNRNINYTNICTYACKFCAFSKGPSSDETLRGAPYLISLPEITRRTAEAWDRGATEVCMQGGIHPEFTGHTYLGIVEAAKAGAPGVHVHAFSPLEVAHGAETLGWSVARFLAALRDAGLGSLPGTAAEVLDDDVRSVLCPDKINTQEWVDIIRTAHSVGLNTTSTIMFGHIDTTASWARHLLVLRDLAADSSSSLRSPHSPPVGKITEFVPLPFVHKYAPMFKKGISRAGPTLRECFLMHAVARLVLHPHITNIQASWVKMGPSWAAALLGAGCNDMGGTLMNESITRAAGAAHGQEIGPREMEELIQGAGRLAVQRTTGYGGVAEEGRERAKREWDARPLMPLL